jgi:hypothetical protein
LTDLGLRYISSGEPTGIWYIEALLKSPYITGGSLTRKKYFCVGQNPEPIASFNISGSGQNINLINTSSNANTYLWDFGDNTYSKLESPSHTYQPSGNYKICLTASNGCDQDTSCLWFSTGIHPNHTAHDFIIFPNPANEYISIKLPDKETGTILIRLLDIYGRAVTEMFKIPPGQDEFTLSTTHIKAGIYLLEINMLLKQYYKKMIIH